MFKFFGYEYVLLFDRNCNINGRSVDYRLKEREIYIELTESAKEKVAKEGFDPEYGARPIRRALQKHVEDYLSEELLKGTIQKGQNIILDVVNGELAIRQPEAANVHE